METGNKGSEQTMRDDLIILYTINLAIVLHRSVHPHRVKLSFIFRHKDTSADHPTMTSRIFKRSGCANVTLDFETKLQSGYIFVIIQDSKNIFKRLLSH